MSRLRILLRGAQISDVALNPDREYVGGRKESCDIRLQAEKGISREHFKLKFEEGKWNVLSLSRFGEIYTLGQRSENFPLEHAQSFQIPPYEFHFSDVAEAEVGGSSKVVPVSESERTVIGATQQVPYVKMMSSNGEVREMLRLEVGDTWVAGRDPSCQIVIPDQRVSRRQFEVRKINGIYTVIDLGSVNGTFLNGSTVSSTDPQPLKSGDAISVLDNMMYFELHDPNFQYRMDRLEVPPLNLLMSERADELPPRENSVSASEKTSIMPDIDQQEVSPQLSMAGGPFTGMPGQNAGATQTNQFYGFGVPPQGTTPAASGAKKFAANKPLMIIIAAVIIVGAIFGEDLFSTDSGKTKTVQPIASNDPFSRLKPEEQKTVIDLYSLAEKSMLQQKYSFAKENLDKIHKLLPNGYRDSKSMEDEADTNEKTIIAQQEQERLEALAAERAKLFNDTIAKCQKIIGPDIVMPQLEECAIPILQEDPTYAPYMALREQAEKIILERQAKADAELNYQSQVTAMDELFEKAEKIRQAGLPYKAMRAYKLVIDSTLPDPKNHKTAAKKNIKFIEEKVAERSINNIRAAEIFATEGKLKEAIAAFKDSLIYDPENQIIKEKIDKYTDDLRRKAMVIYQESIIDENYGNVEGGESRAGAKEKWQQILSLDIEDGEYYRKAFIKLRRYGAL